MLMTMIIGMLLDGRTLGKPFVSPHFFFTVILVVKRIIPASHFGRLTELVEMKLGSKPGSH